MQQAHVRHRGRGWVGLAAVVLAAASAQAWWSARVRADVGADVAALARPGDIRMLSSDTCAVCDQARQWFVAHAVPFSECSIERDSACRAVFEASRAPGTPVLLVRERALLGFSPERLRAALAPPG